jgi:hypothetical protein
MKWRFYHFPVQIRRARECASQRMAQSSVVEDKGSERGTRDVSGLCGWQNVTDRTYLGLATSLVGDFLSLLGLLRHDVICQGRVRLDETRLGCFLGRGSVKTEAGRADLRVDSRTNGWRGRSETKYGRWWTYVTLTGVIDARNLRTLRSACLQVSSTALGFTRRRSSCS